MANKPVSISFKNNEAETKMRDFMANKPSPSAYIKEMMMKDDEFLAYIGSKVNSDAKDNIHQTKKQTSNISSLSSLKNAGR